MEDYQDKLLRMHCKNKLRYILKDLNRIDEKKRVINIKEFKT